MRSRDHLLKTFYIHKRGILAIGEHFLLISSVDTAPEYDKLIVQSLEADGFIVQDIEQRCYRCTQEMVDYFKLMNV